MNEEPSQSPDDTLEGPDQSEKIGKTLTASDKINLRKKLDKVRQFRKWIETLPSQVPPLQLTKRPDGSSNIFYYASSAIDYEVVSKRLLPNGNKTVRESFRRYFSYVYSALIDGYISDDGNLSEISDGVELYSLNLRGVTRNYAGFNKLLNKNLLLDHLDVHNNNKKKGKVKCKRYDIPAEIVHKGVKRVFLSQEDKLKLTETILINRDPDQTDTQNDPIFQFIEQLLRRTTVDREGFDGLEFEVDRYRRLYQSVVRFDARKFDLQICKKTNRVLSVYLQAPREFRKLLRLDGKQSFVEGDVSACHFHFFLDKMTDEKEREQMKQDLLSPDPYLSMCGKPVGVTREALKQNSHIFKYGNRKQNFYLEKKWDKGLSLRGYRQQPFYRHISKKYPVFSLSMAKEPISHKKHRSELACEVMKRESKVMVQDVGSQCKKENLVYLPVHDGFMTLPDQYGRVCEIVTDCFQKETGSVPKIRQK